MSAMQLSKTKPANSAWSGTTSNQVNSIGTGNALMMAGILGALFGRSVIKENSLAEHNQHTWPPVHKGCHMRNKILTFVIFCLLTGLYASSPWLTRETTSTLAKTQFNRAWNTVIDGCGIVGNELVAKEFRKVPFGAVISLDYQCGLVMPDEPPLHTSIFVSFTGIAFGYPKP